MKSTSKKNSKEKDAGLQLNSDIPMYQLSEIAVEVQNERKNFENLLRQTPEMVCILSGPEHRFEFVNDAHVKALGFNATGMTVREAQPESVEVHGILDKVFETGITAELYEIPVTLTDRVRYFNLTYAARRNIEGDINGISILGSEVTHHVIQREVIKSQKLALELALRGAPLEAILGNLVNMIEMYIGGGVSGSILLLDKEGKRLIHGAAPSLPKEYSQAINGIEIGPTVGSCGAAAALGKTFISNDIGTDPLWLPFKDLALGHGLRACWSTPIFSSQNKVLGTFALYYKTPRNPSPQDQYIVDLVTHTAAIVIERKNAHLELENTKDQAEVASVTKTAFLANMSHEIRTPLGAIMGFVDLLRQPSTSQADTDYFLSVIERNAEQLLTIFDDILDLSKIEAGKLNIENTKFSLNQFLSDVSLLMNLKATEKNILFRFKRETALPEQIITDVTRLRQILVNIIGNAIKFTDRGFVELSVSYNHPNLEFKVSDSGRGISLDQSKNLFQSFSQGDTSNSRKHGGTGLGLCLTKKLSEALGGNFWLEKSQLGIGSIFISKIKVEVPEDTNMFVPTSVSHLSLVTDMADSLNTHGMRILVVEDSPDNQALIKIILERMGANIKIAPDGQKGVEYALKENFDLVLMDVQMPIMDGHEATRTLRSKGYKKPIVALTAHALKEEKERAMISGFSDFVPKPIQREELNAVLLKYSEGKSLS